MAAIDLELWIIDGFLRDLQTRRARAKKSAAPPPIQFHFRFARPRHQIGQIKPEKIVPFDYVRIAFLNNCRELFERVMFGLLSAFSGSTTMSCSQPLLSDKAMLAIGFCDASARSLSPVGESTSSCIRFSSSNGSCLNKVRPSGAEIMLHRIAQGEETAPRFFQAVAQRDQLFPAIDGDEPIVSQVTGKFLCVLEPEIGDIAIRPDKGMKRLNIYSVLPSFSRR